MTKPDASRFLLEQFDEIVDFLANGYSHAPQFLAAIDRHKAAIKSLAAMNLDLLEQKNEADEALAFEASPLQVSCEVMLPSREQEARLVFRMSFRGGIPEWSFPLPEGKAKAFESERLLRRAFWRTHLNFSRRIHRELKKTFNQVMRKW